MSVRATLLGILLASIAASLSGSPALASHGPPSATGGVGAGVLSTDGATVYFVTDDQLLPEDTDSVTDIYSRTGSNLELISTGSAGGNGAFAAGVPLLVSTLGDRVFFSTQEALEPEDTDASVRDMYERSSGVTRLVSTGPAGSSQEPGTPRISADGTRFFFTTNEALLPGDTDTQLDVYERAGSTTYLRTPGTSSWLELGGISHDGEHIVFRSNENLLPADLDNRDDVYEYDGGTLRIVSQGPTGGNALQAAGFTAMTPDGTHIYFATLEGLVAQDGDGIVDIYERAGGATTLITTSPDDSVSPGSESLEFNAVSEDGSTFIFSSRGRYTADDLTAARDVFAHSGGTTRLLSNAPGAICGFSCDTWSVHATPDGSHVYFETFERLVPADPDGCRDLYEHDGSSLRLVGDRPSGAPCPLSEVQFGAAAADGSRVIFVTGASLVPGDSDSCGYDDESGDPTTDGCRDVYEDEQGVISHLSTPSGGAHQAGFGTATRDASAVTFVLAEEFQWFPFPFFGPPYQYLTRVSVPSYVRPKGASPMRVPLVPAAIQCTAPNRTHGPPLAFPSCNPPQPGSPNLTVGVGDGSPAFARSEGFVRLGVITGAPGPPDDSDVGIRFRLTNVMHASSLAEYTGELAVRLGLRLTDRSGGVQQTAQDLPFSFTAPCTGTPSTLDASTCAVFTSADAILPGGIPEGVRTIWGLDQVKVFDGGPDGDADTTAGNSLFAVQGLFVP